MLFYPILLPWPILLHALGLTALGGIMVFKSPTDDAPEDVTTLGIATVGLGMSYIATSYMPAHENQFLHASAPVRVLLASLALVKWLLIKREPRDSVVRRRYTRMGALLGVALYDGLGGLWWGGTLGRLGGRWWGIAEVVRW